MIKRITSCSLKIRTIRKMVVFKST
jgi:hypothetical protein